MRLGLALSLAGFGVGALGCAPHSGEQMLEVWAAGREGEVLTELMPAFEAQHPGLHVHVQQLPWRGAHEKLLTAVVGDSTPDVAQLGNTWLAEFATIGALAPLDAELAASSPELPNDYFPGVWATSRVDGQLFGVPWYVDTRLLFYRRDQLQGAGFSQPPASWGEWLTMLRALRDRGARTLHDADAPAPLFLPLNEPEPLLALALQQPDPLLRAGGRFGNFRSQGFGRALDFYVSLFQAGLAPLEASTQIANLQDEFGRGAFTFFISGPWQLGALAGRLPAALGERWDTAALPGAGGPGSSLALGASLVVFARSPRRARAWQLIEYLSEPAVQRRFYDLTGDLPPRRSSWTESALDREPHVAAFRDQLERVEATPALPEWERIATEVAIVGERAARGLLSVERAGAELDVRVDRILEKRRWMLDRGRGRALEAPPARLASSPSAPNRAAPDEVGPRRISEVGP